MSPVRYQPSGVKEPARRRRIAPVAAEQRRPADQDLAVVGELDLDRRDRPPHRPEAVVALVRGRGDAALGGAVALHDHDAEVLPGLLQRGRQERGRRDDQIERAAELAMDLGEEPAPGRVGEPAGDQAQAVERRELALPGDLGLDGRPEQIHDLRDQHERRGAVVADGLEDDPRAAAADVQHVRSDAHGVEDQCDLLEQVRDRQQRDGAVLLLGEQVVGRVHRPDQVAVSQHHAFRLAGRARGEDDLGQVLAAGAPPGVDLRLPVGREGGVGLRGKLLGDGGGEVLEPRVGGVRGVAAGAEHEVAGVRAGHDPLDRAGRHAQVERHGGDAGPHRPEVEGRHGRARRRPDQQPIAGRQPERPKPPGDDPAAPVQLAVGPVLGRPVVAAHAEGEPIAVAVFALVDDVEQATRVDPSRHRSEPGADGARACGLPGRRRAVVPGSRSSRRPSGRQARRDRATLREPCSWAVCARSSGARFRTAIADGPQRR